MLTSSGGFTKVQNSLNPISGFSYFYFLIYFSFLPCLLALSFLFWLPNRLWSSQARDQIRTVILHLHHNCNYTRSFKPLCQARNQTCILALQRHHHFCCTTAGTPRGLSPFFGVCVCARFLGLYVQHMEVTRLGVNSEL